MTRWLPLLALVLGAGCIDALAEVAENIPGSGGGTATAGPGGAGGSTVSVSSSSQGGTGLTPTSIAECQGHIYECGDLLDNDMDELVDSVDPDCLGPCDHTEDSYFGGIPGAQGPGCTQDCYFDQDSGAGNDDCYWNHQCDSLEGPPNFYPEPENGNQCGYNENASTPGTNQTCAQLRSAQSAECLSYCGPLTPNGCDCFGCCELPQGTRNYIWLGSTGVDGDSVCTGTELDNPDICHPCTPVAACMNTCETCELCVGKTALPPECGDPTAVKCPAGVQQCGLPGLPPCPSAFYCITGCCQAVPE